MKKAQKENVGVMASLPYPDPFEDDDDLCYHNAAIHRGRTVRVKYRMRTAVIQGFSNDSSVIQHKTKQPLRSTRPTTGNVLRPRRPNPPPSQCQTQKAKSGKSGPRFVFPEGPRSRTGRKMPRYLESAYGTLNSLLRHDGAAERQSNVFALRNFLSKLTENVPTTAAKNPSLAMTNNRNPLVAQSLQRESFLATSANSVIRMRDTRSRSTATRSKRFSVVDSYTTAIGPESLDQSLVVKNLSTLDTERTQPMINLERTSRSFLTRPASGNVSMSSTRRGSRKLLFTNSFLKGRVLAETPSHNVLNVTLGCPIRMTGGELEVAKEEEVEESPVKNLDAKYIK